MQIKTTLRFHLTPVRIAIIKNTTNRCWQGCGEKRNPQKTPPTGVGKDVGKKETLVHCWWECKLVQPL
jgi:hypothetical protein